MKRRKMLTARFLESRKRGDGFTALTSPSSDNMTVLALRTFLCDKEQIDALWPWPALDMRESNQPVDVLLQGICMDWTGSGAYATVNTDPIVRFEILRILPREDKPLFEVDGITTSGNHYEFIAMIEGDELLIGGFEEINAA